MTEAQTWLTIAIAQQSGTPLLDDPRTRRTLSAEAYPR